MTRLILDLSHTSHTRAHTGIQHVCRSLYAGLTGSGESVLPVCHDPFAGVWRPLRAAERRNLRPPPGALAGTRGARWPWSARAAGRMRRFLNGRGGQDPAVTDGGFFEPEIFSPAVGKTLPSLLARVTGPRAALFHDAIALRLPELSPPKTVARYPRYLQELLLFDGVAAVSQDAAAALADYWRWLGVPQPPPVQALPLATDPPPPVGLGRTAAADAAPVVLCIGSIEGRKNHLALLEACEMLWRRGSRFELRLIGLYQPQTGRPAHARLHELQTAGRPLHYDGPVPEADLHAAYRDCAFTVYPSLMEGFGLPVLQSLRHGKPCVCSARGALGEAARGGGCLTLEQVDAPALADAIDRLLHDDRRLETLRAEARRRPFKSWSDYARELAGWMRTLPRRATP